MRINYKKIFLLVVLVFALSCERDDICIDPTTPKLIIRFYDANNIAELKPVDNLQIEIDSLGTFIPFLTASTTDSIAVPLRVDIDYTKLKLYKNYEDILNEISDQFIVNYERELKFVSRSCGYKTIYNSISITNQTNNWIQSIEIVQQNILDEKERHLIIYH